MAITRIVTLWTHRLQLGDVSVMIQIHDDDEDTTVNKEIVFPDSVLPAAIKAWEQQVATNKGATLATPAQPNGP